MAESGGLPVLETCEECGACCTRQGSPPGFRALFNGRGECAYPEDVEILASAPEALRKDLAAHYCGLAESGEVRTGQPCLWFDARTRGCRHYEFRPILCREFERGSPACREWRRTLGIGAT